jgi:hypothetical protein
LSGVNWIPKIGQYPVPLSPPLEEGFQTQGIFRLVASAQIEGYEEFRVKDKITLFIEQNLETRSAKP